MLEKAQLHYILQYHSLLNHSTVALGRTCFLIEYRHYQVEVIQTKSSFSNGNAKIVKPIASFREFAKASIVFEVQVLSFTTYFKVSHTYHSNMIYQHWSRDQVQHTIIIVVGFNSFKQIQSSFWKINCYLELLAFLMPSNFIRRYQLN